MKRFALAIITIITITCIQARDKTKIPAWLYINLGANNLGSKELMYRNSYGLSLKIWKQIILTAEATEGMFWVIDDPGFAWKKGALDLKIGRIWGSNPCRIIPSAGLGYRYDTRDDNEPTDYSLTLPISCSIQYVISRKIGLQETGTCFFNEKHNYYGCYLGIIIGTLY